MPHAAKARDVITQLKKVRAENGYSHQRIYDMVEASGKSVSLATIKRIFSDGSENQNFRYEDSIKPIAAVLLDITPKAVEHEGSSEVAALKAIILAKEEAIASERAKVAYLKEIMDQRYKFLKRKDRYIAFLSVIAWLFVLYLMAFDFPNPDYGITNFIQQLF